KLPGVSAKLLSIKHISFKIERLGHHITLFLVSEMRGAPLHIRFSQNHRELSRFLGFRAS
ncbi:hypothetical protein, partial [Acanthopleuribacter pedis]